MLNLMTIYQRLLDHYGPRHWWPAESDFEMVIGAILTQNTNWKNVEQAISNLRIARKLSVPSINALTQNELELLIQPAGFFRQKAERLKLFSNYLSENYQGQLKIMLQQPLAPLREELLSLKGIGPETADAILLYAGRQPSFVVDAYTGRIFQRLGLLDRSEKYEKIRSLFMTNLPSDVPLFNEYHALIVEHAKQHCQKKPRCENCPLANECCYLLDHHKSAELV